LTPNLTAFTGVDSQNLPDVMVSVQFILAIGELIFASFLDHYFIFCKRFQSFLHEKSRQMPALLHTS
ncbi:hypothetical protein, partial [Lactobacillus delbrueckii]|uniref:hypothetical protein n=1 Tax=Lactobacillus delbrueckii TaxID=1584 RepID=UPI0021A831FA